MALSDIKSRHAVVRAMDEFRQLGRDAFLAKYGFAKSRTYFLSQDGVLYDSKAIIGAAHGYEFGTPLRPADFSGGERTVKKKLDDLGFEVTAEFINLTAKSIEELEPGAVLDNGRLMELFRVGLMGGMRRSTKAGHLVIVSDHTKSLYEDRWEGSVLHYTGMGKIGPQELVDQNRTLAQSSQTGVKVYLLEVFVPGRYVFHGPVALSGSPYQEMQPDVNGDPRLVWMFPVSLQTPGYLPVIEEQSLHRIRELRQRALRKLSLEQLKSRAQNSASTPSHRLSQTERIIRDEAVAAYVKRAAEGKCDLCKLDAPFVSRDNEPFLECHHVLHLARGGPDTIGNAVALCPNCHRKMHALDERRDRERLLKRIAERDV